MDGLIQEYIIGNAISTSDIIKEHSLPQPNLIISSPPYFDLINYDDNEHQIGYGSANYESFLNTITDVYHQCFVQSASNASFWLIVDTFKKGGERKLFPFDIVNNLKLKHKKTWKLKDIIIWDKGKNLPWNQKGNFKNQHEYILFFTKNDKYKFNVDRVREITDLKKWWKSYPERYNPDGKAPSNVWHFTTPIQGWGENNQEHFCPLPFPLIEKIISLCSDEDDFIFDPFVGSGSVLAIAELMKRNSAGIDVNESYQHRFRNQVIEGAKSYWEKRSREIRETNILAENFKETNQKLRKLKVADNICDYINKKNSHNFLMYVKDRSEKEIDLVLYKNGVVPDTVIEDDSLKKLIKQAKVTPTIHIIDQTSLPESLKNEDVFRYRLGKFFSYTSKCNSKEIMNYVNKYEYIYSNISIKVPNE